MTGDPDRVTWRDAPMVLVATREVNERMRRKSYWVILAVTMAAIAALIVIPNLLSGGTDRVDVAVVSTGSDSASIRQAIEQAARAQGIDVEIRSVGDRASASSDLRADRVEIAVVGTDTILVKDRPSDDDTGSRSRLLQAISTQLRTQAGLEAAGITPDQVGELSDAPSPTIVALDRTDPDQGARRASATVLNILLLLLLQLYGSWVLNGVTEEKTSRVAEVLLATTGPRSLLSGKLIGVGLAALVHGAALVATAVVASLVTGSDVLSQIEPSTLAWGLGWLMLGYAFYCCVYAAVGATVTRVEEAQSASFPILLPLLFTYLVAFTVIWLDTPPWWFQVLAYLPPTSPIAMAVLQANGQATWWQGMVSMLLCVGGVVAASRFAAAVYRGSILHTNGRIKFREALRNQDRLTDTA
ncbi:MAG: ABC transporter permease [Acidimicrobiales bacterium]